MNKREILSTVLDVAMLTNDRSPGEQRAMLDLALEVDSDRGQFVITNPNPMPPTLVSDVEATYEPSVGRSISLTAAQREKYDRLVAQWRACAKCGWPFGTHGADERCPDRFTLNWWPNLRRVETAA